MSASTDSENLFADEEIAAKLPPNSWMIRPCQVYRAEYLECKSWRGRFHQNYIHGSFNPNCHKWKEDYDNCMKIMATKSTELATSIIEHEEERRKERLAGAHSNNVWEYRDKPPDNWAGPLPEWNRGKESLYFAKQQEYLDKGTDGPQDRSCVIS